MRSGLLATALGPFCTSCLPSREPASESDSSSDVTPDGTGDGTPIPGQLDEHCAGALDPERVYAVAQVDGLQGGLSVFAVDAPDEMCAYGWSRGSDSDLEDFLVAGEQPALHVLYNSDSHDEHTLVRIGVDWLGEVSSDGWPRGFQDDPRADDQVLHVWDCKGQAWVIGDPSEHSLSYACDWARYDFEDQLLEEWQYEFVVVDGGGSRWAITPERQLIRTAPDGEPTMFEAPLRPDGEPGTGTPKAVRALDDGGWIALSTGDANGQAVVQRWVFSSAGVEIDGEYPVDVRSDGLEPPVDVELAGDGALVALRRETQVELRGEVVRIESGGEPETVFITTPSPFDRGDLIFLYGLATGP